MKGRLRTAALNLLLAAGSLVFALVAAEVGLRVLTPEPRGGKEQFERGRYHEHDPVLGWRKVPGAAVRYERRDYVSGFEVNAKGLRGPDRPYEKPAGVERVLALGDSFIEAFMVADDQTPTARLEATLREGGCRAEVINGGTAGYSTDQEYLFFRDEGYRYQPDLVVLFVYHNDVPVLVLEDNLGLPKPLLSFDTSPPLVVNEPVPPYEPPPPAPAAPPRPGPPSHLLAFVQNRLERGAPHTYERLAALGAWAPLRKLEMNEELRLYRVPEFGHLRPAWSAFAWTVETLGRSAEAQGARLALAYIPSRMEVQDDVWELTRIRYDLDPDSYQRGAVAERVEHVARRLRLPFLDLTPALARAEGVLTPVYFPTDSHWNARGMEAGARALGAWLLDRELLPGC